MTNTSRRNDFLLLVAAVVATLVATMASDAAALRPIPDFIHVCKADDPQLNACIVRSIESLQPLLAVGIPAMSVPSLEPLDVGDLLVTRRATANGLQVTAKHLKAYNASQFEVSHMNTVEHGRMYKFDVHFKTMFVSGIYTIDGRILLLPISGSGNFTGRFNNIVSHNVVQFDRVRSAADGLDYINVTSVDTRIRLQSGSVHLHNLLNGDKVLGDTINAAINQNFLLFAEDLIPLVERALNRMFRRIGNNICSQFTMEQFFPAH